MVIEYIRYTTEASRAEALLEAYRTASAILRESPHCLAFELSRCSEDERSYILRIVWDSVEGHLSGFRKSPQFAEFFAAIAPYVGDIKEMRHYDVTDVAWVRGSGAKRDEVTT